MKAGLAAALIAVLCGASAIAESPEDALPLNQIQIIGTHNSYHAGIAPSEARIWRFAYATDYKGLDYRHPSLTEQLSGGVRQIELDVFADSKGGLYAHPFSAALIRKTWLPNDPDFDPLHLMDQPGFKVMHAQDIDYRSVCQPFIACLNEVRSWSQAHPNHLPLFILVETKDGKLHLPFPTVTPENFTSATLDALDQEIASVFPRTELVTPDDVRGKFPTLNQAIQSQGWPTLKQARGKVIFLLDQKKAGPAYLQDHPGLAGRLLFTNADPGTPDAAFIEQNDGTPAEIDALVRQGYLVRTRTDADTKEARTNDIRRRDAAMNSGAQILSTDYPAHEPSASGYVVAFPNGAIARCNPLLAPKTCDAAMLEPKD